MNNVIIGLNAYHGDSSACLVVDGILVAAAEEERFRRLKHWAGFPQQAIASCLEEGGIDVGDITHIAVNSNSRSHFTKKLRYALSGQAPLSLIIDRIRNRKKRHSIKTEFESHFPGRRLNAEIVAVEHHLCHLASAFYGSSFEKAVVVSVDGFGDFSSAAWGVGADGRIKIEGRVFFPHSLGVFYQALTQFLGFPNYGDEYKVMGLAPYGKPIYMEEMREIVRSHPDGSFELDLQYFRHHREKIDYAWSGGVPSVGTMFSPQLMELLGPARRSNEPLEERHKSIAHSVQARYEEVYFNLLARLRETYGLDSIAIAGGCGMNSVANGKIKRNSLFERSYVQSAAGDAGGAIGAAYEAWRGVNGRVPADRMMHAYLGPSYSNSDIKSVIGQASEQFERNCTIELLEDFPTLAARTAEYIAAGLVIGWFQGKMEWGPRALGNRSILCDPRRSDMKDILNSKIKRRESFRPFAPSILREHVNEWFEEDDDVPFMMKVFQIREDKRSLIPAVTHVDGSGRLQTVIREHNRRYYQLIQAFHQLTQVPILLNTSFNENEPIVCHPSEALDCFIRTKMDILVISDYLIMRRQPDV